MQNGITPFDVAEAEGEDEDLKAVLRNHGGKHSLLFAVYKQEVEEIEKLIKEGADVNQQNAVSPA